MWLTARAGTLPSEPSCLYKRRGDPRQLRVNLALSKGWRRSLDRAGRCAAQAWDARRGGQPGCNMWPRAIQRSCQARVMAASDGHALNMPQARAKRSREGCTRTRTGFPAGTVRDLVRASVVGCDYRRAASVLFYASRLKPGNWVEITFNYQSAMKTLPPG